MTTELEALYARLDRVRMTEADRQMAKANLARAEALANFLQRLAAALARLMRGRIARAPRSLDLQALGPNSRA